MSKKHKPSIVIADIKTFREMSILRSIVDNRYNGEMPLSLYKEFLKVITNPELKAYFLRNFKHSAGISDPLTVNTPKNKKKKRKKSSVGVSSTKEETTSSNSLTSPDEIKPQRRYKSIFTVKATDFSCQDSIFGPVLVFRSHKSLYYVENKWFQPHVLKSIDHTFKIKLSDYVGFTFIPYSDKQVFLNMLQQAYLDVEQQIYNEHLTTCLKSIEKYINTFVDMYIHNCQNIKFKTNLEDFSFNEDKQVYVYKFNAVEHLKIKEDRVRLHVPLTWILGQLDKADKNKFQKDITSKYPDGYITIIDLDTIFPNHTSLDVTVVIPKIFISRFIRDESFEIKAQYSSNVGYFKCGISSKLSGYRYQTETSGVVFSDDIKDSLISILRNIDNPYIITFYSAFIFMFNEGDYIVQSNYEKQLDSLKSKYYDYFWDHSWYEYSRYKSGYSPLLPFDTNNTSDWMWLTSQMKTGVFLNAYAFMDKDETFSSQCNGTFKYPVKVYLTVKDASYTYINHFGQSINVEKIIISMYALDTAKSIYRFEVKKDKINESLFFIWSYFSSNNYNKRQDFKYILSLKSHFGITNFYKDSPLDYRSDIGYCDRKWLSDV